ncbi:MAG: ABC transporter permease, partial [Flavisolibacter sp.]
MEQFIFVACLFTLMACNNEITEKKSVTRLPPAPASLEAVKGKLVPHAYETEEVGFFQTFMGRQEPPIWSGDMKDTSKIFRDFVADRKKFSLQFLTDSTVNVVEEGKAIAAQYELEKDTSNAILLLVKYEDESFSATVVGVMEAQEKVRSLKVSDGRFITDRDNTSQSFVAVLGSSMAEDLFGDTSPVGKTISINGKKFQVVGLLESKGSSFDSPDESIMVPIETGYA